MNKSFIISLKHLNQKSIDYLFTYICIIIDEEYPSKSTKIIRVDEKAKKLNLNFKIII